MSIHTRLYIHECSSFCRVHLTRSVCMCLGWCMCICRCALYHARLQAAQLDVTVSSAL
jgi:hypothetical protein